MINGYVNIPSELSPLGTFFQSRTIPGIYNKMVTIANLKKPIVGLFSLAPFQNVESIFTPIFSVLPTGEITLGFTYGDLVLRLTITNNDQVVISE